MKNKKQFTLIELIIVIVVIGILAGMALPKFNGVVRDAKLAAMINDKEVLEKTLVLYYQKNDILPLLNEDEEFAMSKEGISLTKIVLAEEAQSGDMDTIYTSLKETLSYYKDSEETLYRIDLPKIKDNLTKDIKYGHKKHDKDFYVYSIKTGNVYYYDYLVNGQGTIQHSDYDTLLKDNELLQKTISPSLNDSEGAINNKPIIELITNLEGVTTNTIINWKYTFTDEDTAPTKISFVLNDIEYDSFDKIPIKLDSGEYNIKLKMQDSKGLWSDELIEKFNVEVSKKVIYDENLNFLNSNSSIIKMENGDIVSFGWNSVGQLGLGNSLNQKIPTLSSTFNSIKFKKIKIGYQHSMGISEDNKLYSWGRNDYGQLGIGNNINNNKPTEITLETGVSATSFFIGEYVSYATGDNGALYSWGKNDNGQLGIGNTTNQNIPKKVLLPNSFKCKEVLAESDSVVAIGINGEVYAWGNNMQGQLGLGNTTRQTTPQKVYIPGGAKVISGTLNLSTLHLVTDSGILYGCGYNNYGQLGIDTGTRSILELERISFPSNIKVEKIYVGRWGTIVLGNDNNIYTWGNNDYGQLGIGNNTSKTTPQKVTIPNGEIPTSILVNTYHVIVNTNDKNVYSWGYNNNGQLGVGNKINQTTPQKVEMPNNVKVNNIIGGKEHYFAITTDGELFGWGDSSCGQLGLGTKENQLSPIKIELP